MITSTEVIEERINLTKDIVTSMKEGQEKGLLTEEYTFCGKKEWNTRLGQEGICYGCHEEDG